MFYDTYWISINTAAYGNCFIFNSHYNKIDPDPKRKVTLTGSSNGLTLEVYLDQKNYMLKKLSKKAGARLVIHDASSPPLADEYGINLQPNTASSVAIQQARTFFLKQICKIFGKQKVMCLSILEQDHKDESSICNKLHIRLVNNWL